MSRTPADPPLRQLIRLRAEMGVSTAQLTAGMFPDRTMLGIEFGIVARVCLPDWTQNGVLARPEKAERAITIRQMALSLGRPAESTRRHANLLIDRGIFAASPRGVSLAVTPENAPLMLHYYTGIHDRFVRLIEDMAATCDLDLPVGDTPAFSHSDLIERAMDQLLLAIDTFRVVGNSFAHMLWAALAVVAVRGVTYDPVLARRYANAIPPDDLRASVTLRQLAFAMSIPYATAWRHIQALHAAGLVARVANDRWTVPVAALTHDSVQQTNAAPSVLLLNKIRELALLGFDPARAADHYFGPRPPLADLGMSQNG